MATLETRLAADLKAAFPDFVREHQHAVYSTALGLARNHHDAEDIAQEAFVRAYRAMADWDAARIGELRSRAWLAQITVNLCRNEARRRSRRLSTTELPDGAEAPGSGPGPEEVTEAVDGLGAWRQRLSNLAPGEAAAVVLRHVWGLKYGEIAESMGVAEGTAKARVHRGLEKLRTMVEEVNT